MGSKAGSKGIHNLPTQENRLKKGSTYIKHNFWQGFTRIIETDIAGKIKLDKPRCTNKDQTANKGSHQYRTRDISLRVFGFSR